MALTDIQEINSDGTSVSTDNMSNLMSEQNQDMATDAFGEQVENVSDNFEGSQEYLNFSLKRLGKAIVSGGMSETKLGKKVVKKIPPGRVAKAILTGGVSEKGVRAVMSGGLSLTKAGKKVEKKVMDSKAMQVFKTFNLAPVRGAYLGLARLNAFGIASQLQEFKDAADKGNKEAKDKWDKVTTFWYKMGGNRTKFADTIKKGSKKKPFLKKGADGSWEYPTGVEEVAAMLLAAAAVVGSVKGIIGKKPPQMDATTEAQVTAQAAKDSQALQEGMAAEQAANIPESERDLDI